MATLSKNSTANKYRSRKQVFAWVYERFGHCDVKYKINLTIIELLLDIRDELQELNQKT